MGPLAASGFGALATRLVLSLDKKPTSSLHHLGVFLNDPLVEVSIASQAQFPQMDM